MSNVSTVVSHILKMPPVLSLKELSKKLAMLLALSNASRSSDLHALDLRYRAFHEGGVTFKIPTLTKKRRSGPPKEVSFTAFDQDPTLCPVATLKQYEDKTTFFRHSQRLFLSFRKPHKPVSSATIAHWLKELLHDAGIDTDTFKAHSTRSAASSAAKYAGMSTADLLKLAGWTRTSTFEHFYHKPIMDKNKILAFASQGKSLNNTMSYMQPCHDMELKIPQASEGCEVESEFH